MSFTVFYEFIIPGSFAQDDQVERSMFLQYDQVGRSTFLQGDRSWEVHCSVEALAEIFDFAAGLVQRVPKRMSIAKSDL